MPLINIKSCTGVYIRLCQGTTLPNETRGNSPPLISPYYLLPWQQSPPPFPGVSGYNCALEVICLAVHSLRHWEKSQKPLLRFEPFYRSHDWLFVKTPSCWEGAIVDRFVKMTLFTDSQSRAWRTPLIFSLLSHPAHIPQEGRVN